MVTAAKINIYNINYTTALITATIAHELLNHYKHESS